MRQIVDKRRRLTGNPWNEGADLARMTPEDDRQDELLETMALSFARYCCVTIDPAGNGTVIDLLRLIVCDMLDGAVTMLPSLSSLADEWWSIEFRLAETR